MSASPRRASSIVVLAVLAFASGAGAQEPEKDGRFVTGPIAWTPTFELRDAGVDSNVFNTPTDAKEDMTATARSQVDSVLKLGLLRATTVGGLEYNYFEQYTSQRGLNRRVSTHVEIPVTRFSPNMTFLGEAEGTLGQRDRHPHAATDSRLCRWRSGPSDEQALRYRDRRDGRNPRTTRDSRSTMWRSRSS
jgi:hypothetical protein